MKTTLPVLASLALVLLAAPASAHHSTAMYDSSKSLTMEGVVQEVEWVNPHVMVHIMVADPKGGPPALWSLESSSPGVLNRSGLNKRSFNPGDRIKVEAAPLRSGGRAGAFRKVTLANGEVRTVGFK